MEERINLPETTEWLRRTVQRETGLLEEMERDAIERWIPICLPETAAFLRTVVRMHRPLRILEAGTAIGYSAAILIRTAGPEAILDTIELDPEMVVEAAANLKRLGLDRQIRILEGDALDVMQCLNTPYDLIFLDAAKGRYPEYLPEVLRLLRPGGVLISDNVLYKGLVCGPDHPEHKHRTITQRLREYLDTICNHPALETSLIPLGDGIALSVRR